MPIFIHNWKLLTNTTSGMRVPGEFYCNRTQAPSLVKY